MSSALAVTAAAFRAPSAPVARKAASAPQASDGRSARPPSERGAGSVRAASIAEAVSRWLDQEL